MNKHRDLCSWISDSWFGVLLCLFSIAIIYTCYVDRFVEGLSMAGILLNISYSILASFVFYLIIDVYPSCKRTKIMRGRILRQFRRIKEEFRLCKSVVSPFVLDSCDSLKRDEFVTEFEKLDLNLGYMSDKGISKKEYLESHKDRIEFLLNQVLEYHKYLNGEELKIINDLLVSPFLLNSIQPINRDLPDELIAYYPNNQREIGESIYDMSKLVKQI